MNIIYHITQILGNSAIYSSRKWKNFKNTLNGIDSQYIELIESEEIKSDEVLAEKLFKTDFKDEYFRRTKRTLTEKLLFEILQFTPSGHKYSSLQINRYKCLKLNMAFKILSGLGQNKISKYIIERVLKISSKYMFTEMRMGAHQYLVKYYAVVDENEHLLKFHSEQLREYSSLFQKELNLYSLYQNYNLFHHQNSEYALDIQKRVRELKSDVTDFKKSYKIAYHYFLIKSAEAQVSKKYRNGLRIGQEGLRYFNSLPFNHMVAKAAMLNIIAYNYTKLGLYTEAKQALTLALDFQQDWRQNWVVTKKELAVLHFFTKDYDSSFQNLIEIIQSRKIILSKRSKMFINYYLTNFRIIFNAKLWHNDKIHEFPDFNIPNKETSIQLVIAKTVLHLLNTEYNEAQKKLSSEILNLDRTEMDKDLGEFIALLRKLSFQADHNNEAQSYQALSFLDNVKDNENINASVPIELYSNILKAHYSNSLTTLY